MDNPRFVTIGAGCAGTGTMLELEELCPGCCVAFADYSREIFDQTVKMIGQSRAYDRYGIRDDFKDTKFYADVDKMLAKEDYDGIIIATYCSSHCEMVEKAVRTGRHIFLEKPIAITEEQIDRVYQLLKNYNKVVVVDFPLRVAPYALAARNYVQSGEIGKIISVQYINNVHYGDGYFRKWMRTEGKIGNLMLQKATHDFDLINYIIQDDPVSMAAFGSRMLYGGDKPDDLICRNCSEKMACTKSVIWRHINLGEGMPDDRQQKCVFSREIDIDDNQAVIIRYQSGATATYGQTFNAPPEGGQRGGMFVGSKGIMEIKAYGDLKERFGDQAGTSQIDIYYKDRPPRDRKREVFDWIGRSHFNGSIVQNFYEAVTGKSRPIADIRAGYISAKMCINAQKSIVEKRVIEMGGL